MLNKMTILDFSRDAGDVYLYGKHQYFYIILAILQTQFQFLTSEK